jgi:hypothetical protein
VAAPADQRIQGAQGLGGDVLENQQAGHGGGSGETRTRHPMPAGRSSRSREYPDSSRA